MWEIVAPILPSIRLLPSGRRLLQKFNAREGREGVNSVGTSGTVTPQESLTAPSIAASTPPVQSGAGIPFTPHPAWDRRSSSGGMSPIMLNVNALNLNGIPDGNPNPVNDVTRATHRQYNYVRYGPGPYYDLDFI
jgi:hypothetical protein